ncbi:MAG: glycerol-3-phosphate dehydrogenase/oxidase [Rhizobiales bacterium]|nr:glycerol-3-phosphate dehydrogenase/oxidase [Hyphomicrobiales bacterium]NRB15519.1 glycerol-3-phosphate dehydrogenase/oxidase [Hyphomicrobiales bacterium]
MSVPTRENVLDTLRQNQTPQVLIVGGGINGIGLYRELALQGIEVVLVERNDFCSGASTALSRMIHGGLRYMENGEFQLVKESLHERNNLLKNAPHYVAPLPTIVPIFSYSSGIWGAIRRFLRLSDKPTRRGAFIVKMGLTLYDLFTKSDQVMPKHIFRNKANTFKGWPAFHPDVKCSATYYDAWITYPERLGLEMINDVGQTNPNAIALNYMNVEGAEGKTVQVTDALTQQSISITPDIIVNATGAWVDFTNGALSASPDNKKTDIVGGTKGSHLVIRNDDLLAATGGQMVYYENQEGRICILFPYFGNVLVGSTDLKLDDPEGNKCEDFEREYILESLKFVFPKIEIAASEILYSFSGVRPLPQSDSTVTGKISRDHYCKVVSKAEGFETPVLCMIGGKWTTFRAFGEQVADQILDMLELKRNVSTKDLPIGGGRDFPRSKIGCDEWVNGLSVRSGLKAMRVKSLVERYGTIAERIIDFMQTGDDAPLASLASYSKREIEYIILNEHIVTLSDILCRRTSIAISGDVSLTVINEILEILASLKQWTKDQKQAELDNVLYRLSHFHNLTEDVLRQRGIT